MEAILKHIERIIAHLQRRVMLMVGRGIVNLVDDSGKVQGMQVGLLSNEVRDQIENVQQFGFSSVPPKGSEAVAVFHGGTRDHGIIVATGHRDSRPRGLKEGEAILYNSLGDSIKMRLDGVVEINCRSQIILNGNMRVNGTLSADEIIDGQIKLGDHQHPIPNGPNTGGPI